MHTQVQDQVSTLSTIYELQLIEMAALANLKINHRFKHAMKYSN